MMIFRGPRAKRADREAMTGSPDQFRKEKAAMRCKVSCNLKQPYEDGFYLGFHPVYTGSEENKEFFKYTPGGTITFNVLNRAAAENFEVGKEYYVDFTLAG